jgi:Protein of unknown function (DUF938)
MSDDRQYAPAALRNRDFILDVLRDVLPKTGVILEIASGSGEHVVHFARNLPSLVFQPSDPDPDARLSVAAWANATGVTNVRAPIALDASNPVWPIASADGILCINMIHISPWDATLGSIKGAAAILPSASPLYLYGPYKRNGLKRRRAIKRSTEPSRLQPELESARPRSGCRHCAIRWILGSGYHRNARKQSGRSVPPNVIVSLRGRSPANGRLRNRDLPHDCSRGVGAIDCPAQMRHRPSQTPGSDDHLPEEHTKTRNHNNAKDKTPRVEAEGLVVVGDQPVGIAHAKLLGRPPASQSDQALVKIS